MIDHEKLWEEYRQSPPLVSNPTPNPDIAAIAKDGITPTCDDFAEDCDEIKDKVHCWLYDPAKGMCPYLRSSGCDHIMREDRG